MATKKSVKKSPKKQPSKRAHSRVIFRTHLDGSGKDWFQAGPLWLQAPPFGETDPFRETMSSRVTQRETQAKRQSVRALALLKRLTKKR
jgi:hypothetical protein